MVPVDNVSDGVAKWSRGSMQSIYVGRGKNVGRVKMLGGVKGDVKHASDG